MYQDLNATSYMQYSPLKDAKTLQDPVTHWAKFAGAYKRCGQRVLISANGDMIVRPSYLELRAHFNTAQLRESPPPPPSRVFIVLLLPAAHWRRYLLSSVSLFIAPACQYLEIVG